MLTFIVIITGRFICSAKSYCENNGDIYIYAVPTVIVTITGRFICSVAVIVIITGRSICNVNSYCENNGDIYMQC